MSRGRHRARRAAGCDTAPAVETPPRPAAAAPWWQGVWPALGGFFNLLAAIVGKWR